MTGRNKNVRKTKKQQSIFKSAAKKCKGKPGYRSCMKKNLKK
jgi:hypothetical protein